MDASLKPYELSFEERPDYLLARVRSDSIDRPTALNYLTEVAEKCREIDSRKMILVRDIPVMLSDADLFETTIDFLEMIRAVKTAFVNPHASIEDAMKFALLIGTNRGARYKLFSEIGAAERWLLAD